MSVIAAKFHAGVRLLVQDPRAHETMTSAGARFDWHFRDPDEWELDNCEIITGHDERDNGPTAQVGFLTLRHTCAPENMDLAHWSYSHWSGEWLRVRPSEGATWWIHQANTGALETPAYPHCYATSLDRWGDQPGAVCVWLRTWEPVTPGGSTTPGTVPAPSLWSGEYAHTYVQFGNSDAWTGNYYMMLFPEGTAGQHPVLGYHDGTDWRTVHEFRDAQTQGMDKTFSIRPLWLVQPDGAIGFSGYVVFTWEAGQGGETVLYLPDWPCDPAPYLRIGGRAMMWAWCLGVPQYADEGAACSVGEFSIPADVTAAYDATYVATEPSIAEPPPGSGTNQTDVTVTRGGAGPFWCKVALATDDSRITPIVGRATFTHEPAFGSAVNTTVYDSAASGAERLREVSWEHGSAWRGASATCLVRDREWTLEFRPNQVVTIQAAHTGESLTDQWYGRITRARWRRRVEDGTAVGRVWTLECRDETARRAHKRRGHILGSLAGMPLHDAVVMACSFMGIHPDRIVAFTGGNWFQASTLSDGATPYLPWSESTIGDLTFARGTALPQVLDRLCAMCNWTWGINSGPGSAAGAIGAGDVCVWPKPGLRKYTAADAVGRFGGTEATATGAQYVMFGQEWSSDGDELAIHVEVCGRDARGRPVTAIARRVPSATTSTAAYFVGDYWYESVSADDDMRPHLLAPTRLAELQDALEGCVWRGPAVAGLRGESICEIETAPATYRLARLTRMAQRITSGRQWWVDYAAEAVAV